MANQDYRQAYRVVVSRDPSYGYEGFAIQVKSHRGDWIELSGTLWLSRAGAEKEIDRMVVEYTARLEDKIGASTE